MHDPADATDRPPTSFREIARILAMAFLRFRETAQGDLGSAMVIATHGGPTESTGTGLDLSGETRLSVHTG